MAQVTRFFKLACSGGNERRRWAVTPPWDMDFEKILRRGSIIQDWQEVAIAGRPTKCFDDMPWSLDSNFFVSDRLRAFFETEAPGHAQYLPVRMEGPGVDEAHQRYWAVNWLHLLDCLDIQRSMDEGEAGPIVRTVVIDPTRIPPNVLVGRMKDRLVTSLIRGDLARKIKKAGFTGPQFYGMWMSTDADAPEPIWEPGVRRENLTMPWPQDESSRDP